MVASFCATLHDNISRKYGAVDLAARVERDKKHDSLSSRDSNHNKLTKESNLTGRVATNREASVVVLCCAVRACDAAAAVAVSLHVIRYVTYSARPTPA